LPSVSPVRSGTACWQHQPLRRQYARRAPAPEPAV